MYNLKECRSVQGMGTLGKKCMEHIFQPPKLIQPLLTPISATSQQQGKQKTDERAVFYSTPCIAFCPLKYWPFYPNGCFFYSGALPWYTTGSRLSRSTIPICMAYMISPARLRNLSFSNKLSRCVSTVRGLTLS